MPSQRNKYQTQWAAQFCSAVLRRSFAAQFYAAAEPCRRGHLTALILGNAPQTEASRSSVAGV